MESFSPSPITQSISKASESHFQQLSTITPIIEPTEAPLLQTPVPLGFPVLSPRNVITPLNASRIVPLAIWSNGVPIKVKYSTSGDILAIASSIGVWLYDALTYKLKLFLPTTSPPKDIEFYSDGKNLAVATLEGIYLVDIDTGGIQEIITSGGQVIALSPDGTTLALSVWSIPCDQRNIVKLYELSTMQLFGTLDVTFCVTDLAFSPDNRLLAASTIDNVTVWDMDHVKEAQVIPYTSISESPYALAFSPSGNMLGVATYGSTYLYDTTTWGVKWKLTPPHIKYGMPSYDLTFSPAGDQIASVSDAVNIWDTTSGALVQSLHGDYFQYIGTSWSMDGRHISALSDYPMQGEWPEVTIWDVVTGQMVNRIEGFANEVDAMDWLPDGKSIIAAYGNGGIRQIALDTGQSLLDLDYPSHFSSIAHKQTFSTLAVSPDGRELMVDFYFSGGVAVIQLGASPSIESDSMFASKQTIGSVYSPSGDYLAFGIFDFESSRFSIQVINKADLSLRLSWQLPENRFAVDLAFSSDERFLYFAQGDRWGNLFEVTALDLSTGSPRTVFSIPTEGRGFYAFTLSPDGNSIALAGLDGSIFITTFSGVSVRAECPGTTDNLTLYRPPYFLSWSPSGNLLSYGSPIGSLCFVDPKTGTILNTLQAHTDFINTVRFSPNGKFLATSSTDGTVRIWGVPN